MRFDAAVDFDGRDAHLSIMPPFWHHPRGMIDCMIAAVELRQGASLLAADTDLDRVAQAMGIHLVER